jgi:hypothetical protein
MRRALFSLVVSFLLGVSAVDPVPAIARQAQAASADLTGVVFDPQARVIVGATVTVRHQATNLSRTTTTDENGQFRFLALPPGQYEVIVEASGFAKVVNPNVVLTVGQSAELNVRLEVARLGEEITVEAGTEIVERTRTAVVETIDQRRIEYLPINGRNYLFFALTSSLATRDNAPAIGPAPTSGLSFGGQRARGNNVQVDGVDNNDNSVNAVRATVSQEAVQEFQIIANSYNAEFGRATGGVINIVTRSGTNEVRGSLFGFIRHRSFQARNAFSTEPDPPYTRVQAGATLGGPFVRDRHFYFFSYETTRRQETGFSTIGQGNFDLVPVAFGGATGLLTREQAAFVSNPAVPEPVRAAYFRTLAAASATALFGSPLGPGGPRVFPTGVPLPRGFQPLRPLGQNYPISQQVSFYLAKFDHQLSPAHKLTTRLSVTPSTTTGIQTTSQNQPFGQNAFSRTAIEQFRDLVFAAQMTSILGGNTVNEARFQAARRGLGFKPQSTQVGVNIAGFAFFGQEAFSPLDRVEKRFQWMDNFSLVRGSHSFKFGTDINYIPLRADFHLYFGGVYSFGPLPASVLDPNLRIAPPLTAVQAYGLGLPQSFIQGFGDPHIAGSNATVAVFGQDSWRPRSHLTINYGVRYEVELTPSLPPPTPLSAEAERVLGLLEGIARDYNNVQPRFALAWDPTRSGKMVIRAAYGIFHDKSFLATFANSRIANGTRHLVLPIGAPGPTSVNAASLFQGVLVFPGYLPAEQRFDPKAPAFQTQEGILQVSPLLPFMLPTSRTNVLPYAQHANLTIERALFSDMSVSVAYLFVKGTHLNRPREINPPLVPLLLRNRDRAVQVGLVPPGTNPLQVTVLDLASGVVPTAFFNFFRPSGPNFALLQRAGIGRDQALQIARALGVPQGPGVFIPYAQIVLQETAGSSTYHGFSLNLNKRYSRNIQFLVSYTLSKAIDDSTDLQSQLIPQDSFRADLERSLSNFDQRHRFVLSGVFQSPYRRSDSGFWRKLLADFTLAPILELSSGRPFTIYLGQDNNFDTSPFNDRPNLVGPPTRERPFGTFAVPPEGQIGNLGRNTGMRPGFASLDLRLTRSFFLTERWRLDAIFEVFNTFNRVNVSDVSNNFLTAGQPTAAFDPRQIQLALKITF